jgi:ABC-type transporter Mla subunit MlaD
VLLAVLIGSLVWGIVLMRAAAKAAEELPAAVTRQLQLTRLDAVAEIDLTRGELAAQIAAARRDALSAVKDSLTAADRRIGDSLSRVDAVLALAGGVRSDLKPVLDHAASIAAQADAAAPMFLDCDHNPDCLFNRYVGASKGIERASVNVVLMTADVRQALPAAITTWQGIGTNVNGITDNLNKLTRPKWYDRALGYGFTGLAMYRDLNPATNVVVGITRAVTQQH